MKGYTIKITNNQADDNASAFSAYCQEWDITADHETIPQVLSELFAAIQILETDNNITFAQIKNPPQIQFTIPLAA